LAFLEADPNQVVLISASHQEGPDHFLEILKTLNSMFAGLRLQGYPLLFSCKPTIETVSWAHCERELVVSFVYRHSRSKLSAHASTRFGRVKPGLAMSN